MFVNCKCKFALFNYADNETIHMGGKIINDSQKCFNNSKIQIQDFILLFHCGLIK